MTGARLYAEAHDTYGGIQKTWVNTVDPKRKFSDKERDEETGFDYFGARSYANANYRWISIDPLLISPNEEKTPGHWNLYAFCLNNPLRYRDPLGRKSDDKTINIFVGYEDELDLSKVEELKKKVLLSFMWVLPGIKSSSREGPIYARYRVLSSGFGT